jgi:outer membrane protein assembly factor BamB
MKSNISFRIITTLFLLFSFSCNDNQEKREDTGGKNTDNTEVPAKVYEWRGPNRSGIYNETNLLKSWPEEGPELVWEYDGIGNGYGSPVFTSDRMYIQGELNDTAFLFSFDKDGYFLWKKEFGKEWVKNYDGSRSAPTVIDSLVYVTSGLGNLYCFDRFSGEKLWNISMIDDFEGTYPLFGFSESVIIEGEKVFCTPGGKEHNVIALNRFNAELIWSSKGVGERPGYNSPQIIKLKDRNILVNFSAYAMMGHDTKTGELLWVHEQDNIPLEKREPGAGDTHSNTIIYEDGFIYYTAGDGNCSVKLELSDDGKTIKELWRNTDLDNYMGGIVKLGDHIFGCGIENKDFKSINAQTGKTGKALDIGSGAVISADSMFYYYNFKGEVMLITGDPENPEVVGKFRMTKGKKEHFAHPVINDGKLYVRHGDAIQAYDIREK